MKTPPWKKKNPRKKSTPLTPEQKAAARRAAEAAGRPYPNLVDNMWAARSDATDTELPAPATKKKAATKKAAKPRKAGARKSTAAKPRKAAAAKTGKAKKEDS